MFTITTPIPYANAEPHLGHLLEGIFNDTIARFQRRVQIDQVNLTMGLDQHGLKIYQKALEAGQTPEEFSREQGQKFKDLWQKFEVLYDVFTETDDKNHKAMSQIIWNRLSKKGYIYKKKYDGLYCVGCEDFYAPSQLTEDGNCPIHLNKPIKMSEENYFFKLSEFEKPILNFLNTANIKPEFVRNEWINFVKSGLHDISCSRQKDRLPWGIEVPDDESQVMYVWVEALINYFTALVNPETLDRWVEFPILREETEPEIYAELLDNLPIEIMYCGKDIAKFHLVIFTALLEALEFPLQKTVLVHGFINDSEGRKFSKSLGNGVFPHELSDKVGVDGTRFIMLHEINVDSDTNFDWTRILEAYNSHLADNIGNLVMRVSTLVEKFLDGHVNLELYAKKIEKTNDSSYQNLIDDEFADFKEDPEINEQEDANQKSDTLNESLEPKNPETEAEPNYTFDFSKVYVNLNNLMPKEALDELLKGASFGNELLEKTKPWTLEKKGKHEEAKEILTALCVLLRDLGTILSIFLPESGDRIYQIFTADKIVKAEVLFPKVEIEK